jgi:hypothetical protein
MVAKPVPSVRTPDMSDTIKVEYPLGSPISSVYLKDSDAEHQHHQELENVPPDGGLKAWLTVVGA